MITREELSSSLREQLDDSKTRIEEAESRLDSVDTQLEHKANQHEVLRKGYCTLNDFDEETRRVVLGMDKGQVNAVLGKENVDTNNYKDESITSNKLAKDLQIEDSCFDFYIKSKHSEEAINWLTVIVDKQENDFSLFDSFDISFDILLEGNKDFIVRVLYDNSKPLVSEFTMENDSNLTYESAYSFESKKCSIQKTNYNNQRYMYINIGIHEHAYTRILVKNLKLNNIALNKLNGGDEFVLDNSLEKSWCKERINTRPKILMDSIDIVHKIKDVKKEVNSIIDEKILGNTIKYDGYYVSGMNKTQGEPLWVGFTIDKEKYNFADTLEYDVEFDFISDNDNLKSVFSRGFYGSNLNGLEIMSGDSHYNEVKIGLNNKYKGSFKFSQYDNQRYLNLFIGFITKDHNLQTEAFIKNVKINGYMPTDISTMSSFIIENSIGYSLKKISNRRPIENVNYTSKLNGLVLNALGDSITFGFGCENSWVYYLKEYFGLLDARNYGVSGTSIAEKPLSEWATQTAFVNRFQSMDDNANIVIVFGGTNDFGNNEGITEIGSFADGRKDTLYGATHYLCDGLIKKYPTSRILFLLPMYRNYNNDHAEYVPNAKGYTLNKVREVIKEICYHNGIPTLDLKDILNVNPEYEQHRSLYIPDGLHPNDEAQKRIAKVVGNYLEALI